MDPLRAADELSDAAARPGQRLGDLHAAGTATDDAPALARIGHAVIPTRRVERRASETLAPGDVGKKRLVQKAGGADEKIRNVRVALGGLDVPATAGEPRRDDLLVEANEFGEAAIACDLLDIGPDLGCRRIFARPAVIGLERKLVLTRQHIDEEAWKGVVPPRPADLASLLVYGEIDQGALQRLGHEQTRDARADDHNPKSPISHHTSQDRPDLRHSSLSRSLQSRQPTWRASVACSDLSGFCRA